MLQKLLLSTFILLFLQSCKEDSVEKGRHASEDSDSEHLSSESLIEKSLEERFPIFDTNYDYNPSDRFSASQMASIYPIWNQNSTTQVAFLKTGEDFYSARMNLIQSAKKSIRIQALYMRNDESSAVLGESLIQAVKRGIKVQMLLDPFSVISPLDQALLFRLKREGINIEGYEFAYFNFFLSVINPANFLAKVEDLNRRYHEKMFIVDGEDPKDGIAIIGGSNIANHYFRVDKSDPKLVWMDRDMAIKGPAVADTLRQFEANISEFQSRRTSLGSKFMDGLWDFARKKYPSDDGVNFKKMDEKVLANTRAIATSKYNFNWQPSAIRIIHNRPRANEDLIATAYIEMFNRAEKTIDIVNAFYMPDEDIVEALRAASKRGVKVRIITNHEKALSWISAGKFMTDVARTFYKPTIDGVENISIFEFAGNELLKNGEGQLHSKYALIDEEISIVGSYNMDPRGRDLNSENIAVIASKDFAKEILGEIETLVSPFYSIRVTPEEANSFFEKHQNSAYRSKILDILTPYL